jgi:isopentenyl-diphosphate delta-isomerase
VRDVAPDILLLANIGVVQAREAGIEAVAWLATRIGADAVCVHCNVAQELVQDEGDRDFRGCAAFLGQLVRELSVPVVVKETGCGFAPSTLCRLRDAGVRFVDVSGRGGTTWTGVEAMRGSRRQRALGRALCEWGIPTAAAIAWASRLGLHPIASGGIRGVTDLAAALALGACAVGLALPFLRAHDARGVDGVLEVGHELAEGLRAVMVLTGSRRPADLVDRHRVIDGELARWLEAAL